MKVMLLAAGLGTRLRPVTNVLAKPAVPFLNVPLLFWSLEFLRDLKVSRVIANLHHLPETISRLAPKIRNSGFEVEFSMETAAPLGSGGGLWHARNHFAGDENFLIANADEVILPLKTGVLQRLKETHEASGVIATLLTMRRSGIGTKFGGVWIGPKGTVLGFGFDKDKVRFPNAADGLHYVGVMLLNRRIFKYLPDGESNILYDAVTKAIAAGEKVSIQTEDLVWYETGSSSDYLNATSDLLALISPQASQADFSSPAAVTAKSLLKRYLEDGTHLWESHGGARMFSSDFSTGSISKEAICSALEEEQAKSPLSEKIFAVIGRGALIKSPLILNSVVLPGARVQDSERVENKIVAPA